MKKRSVAVIGGGQMGRALVGGMLASGFVEDSQVCVIDPSESCRSWWAENHPQVETRDGFQEAAVRADVVLLAVKPNVVLSVAKQISGAKPSANSSAELVISIAAGVSLQALCDATGHRRVCRVMPNTPSLVGAGASAYCVADDVSQEDDAWIQSALEGVGLVVAVTESQMDAVTGLSGSGPAYVCLVIEALADGGVLAGLPRDLAMRLATQTVMGTAKMVAETGRHPGQLKDAVASPGGTTIAALQELEQHGLRAALIAAVEASARRSAEMG